VTIIVTGSSGLLGSALVRELRGQGQRVVTLVRREPRDDDEAFWDPAADVLDPRSLAGAAAVIHLAGAGIGDHRWTAAYKRKILNSRLGGTALLVRAMAAAEPRPAALLSASAVGYYGDTGERPVDESAPPGTGFLADLVRGWEAAAEAATTSGIRVVRLRTGLVLSRTGGMLTRMLPIFRAGLGAPLGSGRQYWSWISLDDWTGAVRHVLATPEAAGPVNLTAPEPVTNAEFTRALGRALRRPTLPVAAPGFALRLGLGEFAREGVLVGQRVLPRRLLDTGYRFRHTRLDEALAAVL
jgi:uncharacterized protein (TIGR01777 family)